MKVRKMIQLPKEDAEQINVGKLLSSSLRHWYLFVIGMLLCVGIAYLYLQYATPVYKIRSTLLIKDDKKGPDPKGEEVFSELDLYRSTNNIDNEVEVLNSVSLMRRALAELALQTSYFEAGLLRDREIYGNSLPLNIIIDELDTTIVEKKFTIRQKDQRVFQLEEVDEKDSLLVESYQFGQKIQRPYGVFTVVRTGSPGADPENLDREIIIKFHNIQHLAAYYNEALIIEPVNKMASVLSLNLWDPVPEKGRNIINKLIEIYHRDGIEDKNHMAAKTIDFLDERLQFISEELAKVEEGAEKYKRQKEVTNVNVQAQSYVDNAQEYKKQLTDWAIQIEVLESIESYIQQQGDHYALVPSTLGIKDPTLVGLISKFNELQLERERMLRTAHPSNPLVQNLDVQLGDLQENILENLRNIKNGLIITQTSLQASSGQYTTKIQEVPSIERHLLEINRQQGIKQGLYLYLLQKREESALALAATQSNLRIIDPAIAGIEPASPNKILVLLMAIIMGFGLPLGYLTVKEMMNKKVRERKDVEAITMAPIIGEISHNTTKKNLVVTENSRTPVAELFRHVRTNINFATAGKENKVIMVTSSTGGEGKTFFSINLGASLALAGKKVVIVDLDLRKPRLLADLGFSNEVGVTDYINSPRPLNDMIKPIPLEGMLFAMGTGPTPSNPSEFTMNPKLGDMIQALKNAFDYVIIDTAPVGQVADAFLLAPYVDTSIYMVRYNYTYKDQVEIVDDIFKDKKFNNLMVVLNDAKKENSYRYGYGYGKGYGKGYATQKAAQN